MKGLELMPDNIVDGMSTLVQVMAEPVLAKISDAIYITGYNVLIHACVYRS